MLRADEVYYILNKKIKELTNKVRNAGNDVINVTANQPFPSSWHTSGTLSQLITDINNDSTATKGKIYLSTVSFSDLPSTLMLAEMKVEIMSEGKVILFTVTSENVAPYHWEATSAYGRSATWRSFLVLHLDLSGKLDKITSSNKLSSDLVNDTNKTHKFVTSLEKSTWNNKLDRSDIEITEIISSDFLDILYSDSLGNLSISSLVLPTSENKIPIALCIAPTGFFGANEPARWMSLKYMNYTTPETGALSIQSMYWGNRGIDISTINNILSTYNTYSGYGWIDNDCYDNSSKSPKLPNVLNENNEWNLSTLGTVNTYAMTDIDGKNKTTKIITTVSEQSSWQTDISITNNSDAGYAPAACCCARYHTLGTQAGDWYLGGCGEMCMILAKKTDIDTKLTAINTVYPNDCISSLYGSGYWTSTEYNENDVYRIDIDSGMIYDRCGKNDNKYVIGMLSLDTYLIVSFKDKIQLLLQKCNSLPNIWRGTQAEYDLILTPDDNTIYIITSDLP